MTIRDIKHKTILIEFKDGTISLPADYVEKYLLGSGPFMADSKEVFGLFIDIKAFPVTPSSLRSFLGIFKKEALIGLIEPNRLILVQNSPVFKKYHSMITNMVLLLGDKMIEGSEIPHQLIERYNKLLIDHGIQCFRHDLCNNLDDIDCSCEYFWDLMRDHLIDQGFFEQIEDDEIRQTISLLYDLLI